jgi:hypothetical protein
MLRGSSCAAKPQAHADPIIALPSGAKSDGRSAHLPPNGVSIAFSTKIFKALMGHEISGAIAKLRAIIIHMELAEAPDARDGVASPAIGSSSPAAPIGA